MHGVESGEALASGRWKRLTHAHQGIWAVSKKTGSSFVLAMGLSSNSFLLPISASMTWHRSGQGTVGNRQTVCVVST